MRLETFDFYLTQKKGNPFGSPLIINCQLSIINYFFSSSLSLGAFFFSFNKSYANGLDTKIPE